MNAAVLKRLLAFRPFKRLYLCIGDHEIEVNRPEDVRILEEAETLVWSVDGTTDLYDLRLIERVRIDDDFGFDELDRMWK
jgi:hypothetical protein